MIIQKLVITISFTWILGSVLVPAQENLKDGFTRFYYGNGQVSSEGFIRNGKPDGKWVTYYVNGTVKSEGLRRNYKLDSIWNFFDDRSFLTEQISYRYGLKNGYHIQYYPVAKNDTGPPVMKSKELYLDNLLQGLSYYYAGDGRIKRVIRYKDGKKNGLMKEFGEDSLVHVVYRYHNDFLIDREFINQKDPSGLKQGTWKDYYENDQIRYEAHYKDGRLNGFYRTYKQDGKLISSEFYEDGQRIEQIPGDEIKVEIVKKYDKEGNVISSGGYLKNIPVGVHQEIDQKANKIVQKEFDNSGQILSSGQITKEGDKEEFWQFFYPGGQVHSEGKFRHNKRTGVWKFYYPGGKIEQTGHYANGLADGLWTWYYKNGSVRREENYYRGKEDGLSVEYGIKGDIITKGSYIEGLKEGAWYYNVGDHTEKGSYQNGLRNGLWIYYYPGGVKSFEGNWVQGRKNGKHRYYYENGKIKEEQYYVMGNRERTWWKFDLKGDAIISYTYKNNVLIKINGTRVSIEE